jgi:hypothetical protein
MAGLKGRGRPRRAAPAVDGADAPAVADRIGDAVGQGGVGGAGQEADPGRTNDNWLAAKERLSQLEREGCPVCVVYWPTPPAALWGGVYGNAKIKAGPPSAVLASGEEVPL